MSDEKKRAMMAAHLGDVISRLLRSGNVDTRPIAVIADCLTGIMRYAATCETDYRAGLDRAGFNVADINTAVAAIERFEHPADSLPGRVLALAQHAARAEESWASDDDMEISNKYASAVRAFRDVLDLLGVKP